MSAELIKASGSPRVCFDPLTSVKAINYFVFIELSAVVANSSKKYILSPKEDTSLKSLITFDL